MKEVDIRELIQQLEELRDEAEKEDGDYQERGEFKVASFFQGKSRGLMIAINHLERLL